METIIGFAAGFLVGTREGRAGLERIRTSLRDIANSPQTRRLASDAITLAGSMARHACANGVGGAASGVAGLLLDRADRRTRASHAD